MLISTEGIDLTKVFFTADNHFGHANIISFCDRPFGNSAEMDAAMVENWNRVIPRNGIVFHLGDFTLGDVDTAQFYFRQLSGRIRLLSNPWHHDRRWLSSTRRCFTNDGFVELLPPMVVLEVPKGKEYPLAITLCHYPLAEWDRKHYGAWHLHGHSHGQKKHVFLRQFAIDVGVDCTGFAPISFDDVMKKMEEKAQHGVYVG